MILQSDTLDEVQVAVENLLRCMTAQHTNEQGDDTLRNQRIAVGGKHQLAVFVVALYLYAALTAVDEVLLCFILRL